MLCAVPFHNILPHLFLFLRFFPFLLSPFFFAVGNISNTLSPIFLLFTLLSHLRFVLFAVFIALTLFAFVIMTFTPLDTISR